MELFAWRCQLLRVVLTVFKKNQPALRLYTRALEYELDETDPSLYEGGDEEEHTILAKQSPNITSAIKLPLLTNLPAGSSAPASADKK